MDCTRGKSASVVECTLIDEAPEADRICLSVIASEKISTRCATNKQNVSQIIDVTQDNAHREAHHCPQNLSRGIVSTTNHQLVMRFINFLVCSYHVDDAVLFHDCVETLFAEEQ